MRAVKSSTHRTFKPSLDIISMISEQREDYIRAIYLLAIRRRPVRNKYLAEYLNVSKNTVSAMLLRLQKDHYVSYERYAELRLTRKGESLARKLTERHRLIELFLTDVLKRDPKSVHEEAGRLEHDFSRESMREMKRILKNPRYDPHGQPIYT
jgi:DtxR family transcriptional regulator, Mn-dependent transcriptional regulator